MATSDGGRRRDRIVTTSKRVVRAAKAGDEARSGWLRRADGGFHPGVAWGIHALTASGVLCGMMGLISVLDGSARAALLWLMLAMVIDGVDGPMARAAAVRRLVPRVDGNTLDLVIDYVTCVVAPALFLREFGMLPGWFMLPGIGLILVSALYAFARTDLLTDDAYFRGFPAMWNLVVNVAFVLAVSPAVMVAVVLVFSALTVTSFKVPHPMRVVEHRQLTVAVLVVWLAALVGLTVSYPTAPLWARGLVLGGVAYLGWLSVRRSAGDLHHASA